MKINSTQNWFPIKCFENDGTILLKNNNIIKILEIEPINFELKTNFEKEVILNNYKTFLKNCNFDFQILIKSSKIELENNIKKLNNQNKIEKNNNISKLSNLYIKNILEKNNKNISSHKKYYLIISFFNYKKNNLKNEIDEKILKIKNSLLRCGNNINEIKNKKEIIKIINNYFNI